MSDWPMLYGWVMFALMGGLVGFVAGYTVCERKRTHGVTTGAAPLPLFAVAVARRKWESLQAEGYRMQRIEFAMSKGGQEKRGSIDPWGKVLWHSDGVTAPEKT